MGGTIQTEWDDYAAACIGPKVDPDTRALLCRTFFAGAHAALLIASEARTAGGDVLARLSREAATGPTPATAQGGWPRIVR